MVTDTAVSAFHDNWWNWWNSILSAMYSDVKIWKKTCMLTFVTDWSKAVITSPDQTQLNSTQLASSAAVTELSWVESDRAIWSRPKRHR